MRVFKFGGSSVGDTDRIKKVCGIIEDFLSREEAVCIVFSAFGDTTDKLIELAEMAQKGGKDYSEKLESLKRYHYQLFDSFLGGKGLSKHDGQEPIKVLDDNFEVLSELLNSVSLSRELSGRFRDLILSYGERNSNYILSLILQSRGVDCEYLDARKIIKTNNRFGGARVLKDLTQLAIKSHFSVSSKTQVVTGFISSTVDEVTTTLGRGGSDYTASLIGSALQCECIEIWTDVNGVLTANPKIVPSAKNLEKLSYMEAMELSHFGAKVLFPPTIVPAKESQTRLIIKNSFNPEQKGTVIGSFEGEGIQRDIAGITSIPDLTLFTMEGDMGYSVHGLAARLFGCLATEDLDVYMITQGSQESCISFAVLESQSDKVRLLIDNEFVSDFQDGSNLRLESESAMSAVAVVGEKILHKSGITGRIFSALGRAKINIEAIAQGSSERTISLMVNKENEHRAVNALHDEFFG